MKRLGTGTWWLWIALYTFCIGFVLHLAGVEAGWDRALAVGMMYGAIFCVVEANR